MNHYKKAAANQWLKVVVSSEMTGLAQGKEEICSQKCDEIPKNLMKFPKM